VSRKPIEGLPACQQRSAVLPFATAVRRGATSRARLLLRAAFSVDAIDLLGNNFWRTFLGECMTRPFTDREFSSRRFDRTRRRLLLLAAMAGAAACFPGRALAQSADMSRFERTIRSLKIWWNHVTREPDEGDMEARDPAKFVAAAPPDPRSWPDGGITLSWIGHSTFLINLEGTTILTDPVFS
jgi:hypothetical protein